jgi:hypothetical protein
MGTEIKVWQISDNHIKGVEDAALASIQLSRHLRELMSPTKFPEFFMRITFFRRKPKSSR